MTRHQVAVVGAGIAGLSVTTALVAAGVDVVCLEATGRAGGRLCSQDVGDGRLDLGATWYWAGERRVQELVTRFGIETFSQHTAGDGLYEDADRAGRLDGNPIDVPAFRCAAGTQSLADALAATLPADTLLVSSPVSSISADADQVQVLTDGMTLSADHVVLAVPPALAVSRIRFEPALPERLAAVAAATPVWMGAVTKVVVQYPEPFWRAAGLAGAAASRRGPLWEIHDMSGPEGRPAALFGFGSTAGVDPRLSDDRAADEVVRQLVRLFGREAASPQRVLVRDWGRQAYTSSPELAGLGNYRLFGHPRFAEAVFQSRLHWASTETSEVSPGHMEGALEAAERVAATVMARISERSVTR